MNTKLPKFFTVSRAASETQRALARGLASKVAHQLGLKSVTLEQVLAHALRRGLSAIDADPIPGEIVAAPARLLTPLPSVARAGKPPASIVRDARAVLEDMHRRLPGDQDVLDNLQARLNGGEK
jgi:hypothetical protein